MHDVSVPTRSASNDLQNTIEIATTLLCSTIYYFFSNLLCSTLLCLYPFSTSTLLYSTLLYSTLFYSSILYSALHYSSLVYSALLHSSLLFSTLRCSILDLWSARMWLHDFLTQVPTGHNDLWAGENVKVSVTRSFRHEISFDYVNQAKCSGGSWDTCLHMFSCHLKFIENRWCYPH